MSRTSFVVAEELEDAGLFCLGIYDDYDRALGVVMRHVFEDKEGCSHDGETFEYTEPYVMEGEGGEAVTTTHNSPYFSKPVKNHYYILYNTSDTPDEAPQQKEE